MGVILDNIEYRTGKISDKSALIVVDMQNYFLKSGSHAYISGCEDVILRIRKLMDAFFAQNLPVIMTKHINNSENAQNMSKWWKDLIKNDSNSDIFSDLCDSRAKIVEKTQYDAFFLTYLDQILRKNGVEQVVIAGVLTHLCCETTARSAFVRGFEVFFTVDGTATYDDKFQEATLRNLSHGFAIPKMVDDVIGDIS